MAIVVGYLNSPEGRAAVTAAIDEAQRRQAEVIVIHSHRGGRSLEAADIAEAERELAEVSAQLVAAGVKHRTHELVRGLDPADDLLEVAGKEQAELIVIGLRRRTPVGKLILGSNSQRILLEADCPVLAVKAAE